MLEFINNISRPLFYNYWHKASKIALQDIQDKVV
jgi:hypothetical protein